MTCTTTDTYSAVISIRLLALIWDDCGYTGHEMLPEFGIINMNGRLYDPVLGRFFSPDPYVQFAGSPQSYNRYSYCLNNPLKYTDPSGQSIAGFVAFGLFNLATSMMRASFNHENIWKAGAMSLLSSAVSYGIGELFKTTGSIGCELLRAGTHGAASGVLNMLGGGDFVSGFVSGAVASGIYSMQPGSDRLRLVKLMTGSAAGGLAAYALGGNFIQGAIQGLKIGLFNHYVHDTRLHKELMQDANGNLYGELAEFVCEGEYTGPTETSRALAGGWISFETLSFSNMIIDNIGKGFKKGGNSTIGSNGKFYIHPKGERGFYGNQSVKALKLTTIGKNICKGTTLLSVGLNIYDLKSAQLQDKMDSSIYGMSDDYHYNKTVGKIFGGFIVGSSLSYLGGVVGFFIGGPPGAMVGSFLLGAIGTYYGENVGKSAVDDYYHANNLFIP